MFRVKNLFEKKNEKKQVCETVVWSLAGWVKNLIEKKMTRSVRQWYGYWRINFLWNIVGIHINYVILKADLVKKIVTSGDVN